MIDTKALEQKLKEVTTNTSCEEAQEIRAETDKEIERMLAELNESEEIPF